LATRQDLRAVLAASYRLLTSGWSLDAADLREIRTALPSFESHGSSEGLADKVRLAAPCSRSKQAGDGRRAKDCWLGHVY